MKNVKMTLGSKGRALNKKEKIWQVTEWAEPQRI